MGKVWQNNNVYYVHHMQAAAQDAGEPAPTNDLIADHEKWHVRARRAGQGK
jgi:hypothetical protein